MDAKPPQRPSLGIGSPKHSLRRSERVLLLVDFINPLEFDGAKDIAPSALRAARMTATLKSRLAPHGITTIYANDNYGVWRSDFRDVLSYCKGLEGEAGEMARLLAPHPDDLTILKPRHSGFYATPLELLLTQMHAHKIIVAGLATDLCVQLTAMDAHQRGYRLWIPADCVAAESAERQAMSLAYMARVLECDIRPAASVDWQEAALEPGARKPQTSDPGADSTRRAGPESPMWHTVCP
jgi:nicotinamidase-related amidase